MCVCNVVFQRNKESFEKDSKGQNFPLQGDSLSRHCREEESKLLYPTVSAHCSGPAPGEETRKQPGNQQRPQVAEPSFGGRAGVPRPSKEFHLLPRPHAHHLPTAISAGSCGFTLRKPIIMTSVGQSTNILNPGRVPGLVNTKANVTRPRLLGTKVRVWPTLLCVTA